MATHENQKVAEHIAFRITGGGQKKIFIEDTKAEHGGWCDWHEITAIILEEMEENND